MAFAYPIFMDTMAAWTECGETVVGKNFEVQGRALRNKLINLTLDWELAALTLDAQRYKSQTSSERESLRDSAVVYRKCIAEVSELINCVRDLTCR